MACNILNLKGGLIRGRDSTPQAIGELRNGYERLIADKTADSCDR